MHKNDRLETGTTTVGIVCKDCAILASESKSTMGYLISSKVAKKVYKVDNRLALTTAGSVGDVQNLVRILKAEINLYKLSRNNEITTKAAATLLSNILQQNRYYPYMAMLIIGGSDKEGHHIYSIDPVGGAEKDNCIATGSGSPVAYGVLDDGFKEGMTKEEGIKLVIRAIKSARERDVFSGGKNIVVVTIDENGVEFIDNKKIREYMK